MELIDGIVLIEMEGKLKLGVEWRFEGDCDSELVNRVGVGWVVWNNEAGARARPAKAIVWVEVKWMGTFLSSKSHIYTLR